jgi:hypothetical protein
LLTWPADVGPVHLRHHDVEQDQVGLLFSGDSKRLLPVSGRQNLVTMDGKARPENVEIVRVVISDED